MAKSACLEIHQINVGQGDSVLIINRDLAKVKDAIIRVKGQAAVPAEPIDYVPWAIENDVGMIGTVKNALLVDGGDDEYGGDIVYYLTAHGVVDPAAEFQPNLMILLSHYHDDHMAGLHSIFKKKEDPPKKKKKNYKPKIVDFMRPAVLYKAAANAKTDPKTVGFQFFNGDLDGAIAAATNPTQRVVVQPGGLDNQDNRVVIDLGTGVNSIPIKAHLIGSSQGIYNKALDQVVRVPSVGKTPDQNDRSMILVLEYGSFRYFLGGDVAGNGLAAGGNHGSNAMDAANKKHFSRHADVESTLGPALEAYFPKTANAVKGEPKFRSSGYCTVMKANHHGSSSSVDVHLLATIQPLLMLISAGVKTRWHEHPTQPVLDRATSSMTPKWGLRAAGQIAADALTTDNTINQVYITEIANKYKGKTFGVDIYNARILGDIVVRPIDETVALVQDAANFGTTLTIQVYGVGGLTTPKQKNTTLRPTFAKNAPGSYPIGPWEHSDTH